MHQNRMTGAELKNSLILALIFACRLLGLFMILPVLALYVDKIPYATPLLIGLAAGIYGFTQALLQFPFGVMSDYWGRKPIIITGLVLFSIGSLVAAFSASIWGLIIGRAIQGMGAIGSPILALTADVTREQVRTRAMALIGISIGFTFSLAFVMGPILEAKFGLSALFGLAALLGIGGIGLLSAIKTSLPAAKPPPLTKQMTILLKQRHLWGCFLSIFSLHAILTAIFLVLPSQIATLGSEAMTGSWQFYLPVLVLSLLLVAPLLRFADKAAWQSKMLAVASIGVGLAGLALLTAPSFKLLFLATVLFFTAFNFLEASLPSLVSKLTKSECRGAAMGMFSCLQFLGMFCGGVIGGGVQKWFAAEGVAILCVALASIGYLALKYFTYTEGERIERV